MGIVILLWASLYCYGHHYIAMGIIILLWASLYCYRHHYITMGIIILLWASLYYYGHHYIAMGIIILLWASLYCYRHHYITMAAIYTLCFQIVTYMLACDNCIFVICCLAPSLRRSLLGNEQSLNASWTFNTLSVNFQDKYHSLISWISNAPLPTCERLQLLTPLIDFSPG